MGKAFRSLVPLPLGGITTGELPSDLCSRMSRSIHAQSKLPMPSPAAAADSYEPLLSQEGPDSATQDRNCREMNRPKLEPMLCNMYFPREVSWPKPSSSSSRTAASIV